MRDETLRAARRYMRKGWFVIPVHYKDKKPILKDWRNVRLQADDLEEHFSGSKNIGVAIGVPSGGLADVDLDCEEARKAAYYFLPQNTLKSGRASSPESHYWYRITANPPAKTVRYRDVPDGDIPRGATLAELRWTGVQTIVPPSVHPSGEELEWEGDGEPAEIDGDDLCRRVKLVVAVALVARHWPARGTRHDCSLALAGMLDRFGFSAKEAKKFIRAAAWIAGDEEYEERARNVDTTSERLKNGEPATGLPTVREFLGKAVVKMLCDLLEPPDSIGSLEKESGKKSQAESMLDIASAIELFRSERTEPFVRVKVNEHSENWPLRSKIFKTWLCHQMFLETGKPPNTQAVEEALNVMSGNCLFGSKTHELSVRVARVGDVIYLDMGDGLWRAIEIAKEGWRIVDQPPILFRRYVAMGNHVEPIGGGTLDTLRQFLNLSNDDDWYLLLAWLVAALVPDIPHPPLVIHGEQGSAKSTCARLIGTLVDPSLAPLRSEPSDQKEWVQVADHSWLVTLDNVSRLQPWLSDALCRAVTGDALTKRELYTNDDDILYCFRRVICLTGIGVVAQRADLLDRSVLLGLEPIPPAQRQLEADILQSFENVRPAIFGALLDTLSAVLNELPNARLKKPPRMADFACIGVAVERVLGWPEGVFMRAYRANIRCQHEEAIDASSVASAVRTLMSDETAWEGSCQQLLDVLGEYVGTEGKMPRTARGMREALQRAAPNLRAVGIRVEFAQRTSSSRVVSLTREA